ncbi:hypothetical protein HYFRA_00000707 [Hymenoscyphus fraxineus]|uniref:2EXR domain-containing protein n=1 Tax=Hymenoscyphus fraxineus TaxID=746836 RepID=A0A9N9KUX3_9HELO|nr:hypothetical protein HYFRA_00000707 [Hymenoscyphus fraxineus]
MDDQKPTSTTIGDPPQSLSSDLVVASSLSAQNESHKPTPDNNTPTTLQHPFPHVSRRTFHKFDCLALELKCLIWDYSFEQRMVEVRLDRDSHASGYHDFVSSRHHNPSVLHTNKESRNYYLKKFIRLGNSDSFNDIYFHPEIDILFFRTIEESSPQLDHCDLYAENIVRHMPNKEKIKNLAGDWWFVDGPVELDDIGTTEMPWAFYFPSLKRLFRVEESYFQTRAFLPEDDSDYEPEYTDFRREINFGNNLTYNRTYFTALGGSSYFNEDLNNATLSFDMVAHFLKKNKLVTCKKYWETMLKKTAILGEKGEPWTSLVAPPIEEFYDLLAFNAHIPKDDYYCIV